MPQLETVWMDLVTQALAALHLYQKDRHYLVKDDKVQIIDEYTGRLMPDRSWEYGLHQLIELKESCPLSPQKITLSRITYQRFFRRYLHLSGMTGTGKEVSAEFWSVYRLRTSKIPTHRPVQRIQLPPKLFRNQLEKWRAVVESARMQTQQLGRPVLIGTCSVESSEYLSRLLSEAGLPHRVLNARQDAEEAEMVAAAGQAGSLMVATNMAGRGTDIKLGPGIAERGGLHIILTAFSESSRIDRQLYGRAGRQGDPGSAEAIVAMDDELFVQNLPENLRFLLQLGLVNSVWVSMLTYLAQSRAERRNARIREQTLVSDRQIDRMLAFAGKESA
jgi:preprotein translocase subunit SecA